MDSKPEEDRRPPAVELDVTQLDRYDRVQLLLRLVIGAAMGMFHQSLIGVLAALYLILPGLSAIMISRQDSRGFEGKDAAWIESVLDWFVSFYAYMLFVTDRFPVDAATRKVRLRIERFGEPSIGEALLRLITSLPHALLLAVLAVASIIVSAIIFVCILFTERAPESLRGFQRDFLASLARFFVFHSALVDTYPAAGSVDIKVGPQHGDVVP